MKIDTSKLTQVGSFGVDSGTVMIVDPCYVLRDERGDFNSPEYNNNTEYLRNVMPSCDPPYYSGVTPDGYNQPLGMIFATMYGDGEYPIFAEYGSGGRITRLVIDFDPQDDPEDDYGDDDDD